MMFSPEDWRKLRFPILGLGVGLVLVGLLVNAAEQYSTKYVNQLQAQQKLLNQARQKYQSSGLEKASIIRYLPVYNALIADGFIGEERRIEWIERLRQLHRQYKLFSIDYSIGTQERYQPTFIPNLNHFVMQRSVMQLNIDLLHEEDLTHLLNGLRENTAPFIVRDCEMFRSNRTEFNSTNIVPNLKAKCEIDWLTLRDPQLAGGFK